MKVRENFLFIINKEITSFLLQTPNNQWSEEDLRQAKYCREELGFFKSPHETHIHEDEYPILEDANDT
jgi:hypothetical protein